MKKTVFVLLSLLLLSSSLAQAQLQQSKKPRPDWAFEKPSPSPENVKNFDYYVGVGYGKTLEEATNKAKADALKQAILRIGVQVSSSDLYKAEQDAEYLRILTQQFEIPIRYLYDHYEPLGDTYKMMVLCQAAVNSNITPRFEVYVETFNKVGSKKEENKKIIRRSDVKALVASSFIPGMGQMLKKQGGAGAGFLLSELALFGGGTTCYFLGDNQMKIMKATGTTYAEYQQAKNTKNILNIAMWTCFGVGAALHITNMVHAWLVKDKNLPPEIYKMSFSPVLIPTNEYSTPNYAMGAGVQITF